MGDRYATGIDILDRRLDGGIPGGSVVALTASPASQAELFLRTFTTMGATTYLSTRRSGAAVRRSTVDGGDVNVYEVERNAPTDHANRILRSHAADRNLVVDPVDPLERDGDARFASFLDALERHVTNTNRIGFLYGLDGRAVSPQRDLTEYTADIVFRLSLEVQGDAIEARLAVPKFRGGHALDDVIKLELTDEISIDTSRDIT